MRIVEELILSEKMVSKKQMLLYQNWRNVLMNLKINLCFLSMQMQTDFLRELNFNSFKSDKIIFTGGKSSVSLLIRLHSWKALILKNFGL